MLTVFGNLKINSEAKLQYLKDSFFSFSGISDDWLINIRGDFRDEAISFLKDNLGDKARFFELLDDARGWTANALEMLSSAKHDYILVWLEDHMNIAPQHIYEDIISEMRTGGVEYMPYSWWFTGKIRKNFDIQKSKNLDIVYLTKEKWKPFSAVGKNNYLIHLTGIFSKVFFKKLLKKDKVKASISIVSFFKKVTHLLGIRSGREKWFNLVNKLFFGRRLRKFSAETPFNLEYESYRTDILPIMMAFPRQELFACIDDDIDERGSQLIKRGLYPPDYRLAIGLTAKNGEPEKGGLVVKEINLSSGEVYKAKYYEDSARTKNLIEEKIFVKSGRISVSERGRDSEANANTFVVVYPGVGYAIKALEDSSVEIFFPDLNGKQILVLD